MLKLSPAETSLQAKLSYCFVRSAGSVDMIVTLDGQDWSRFDIAPQYNNGDTRVAVGKALDYCRPYNFPAGRYHVVLGPAVVQDLLKRGIVGPGKGKDSFDAMTLGPSLPAQSLAANAPPPMPLGPFVPAPAPDPASSTTAPAPVTYSDPFLYCKTFGDVDKPGKRYVGLPPPEALDVLTGGKGVPFDSVHWRCTGRAIVACLATGAVSCAKGTGGQLDARGFVASEWKKVPAATQSAQGQPETSPVPPSAPEPTTQVSATLAPSPTQSFTDPRLYCWVLKNVDVPSSNYIGPSLTEGMAKLFKTTLSAKPDLHWRCKGGFAFVCKSNEQTNCDGFRPGEWFALPLPAPRPELTNPSSTADTSQSAGGVATSAAQDNDAKLGVQTLPSKPTTGNNPGPLVLAPLDVPAGEGQRPKRSQRSQTAEGSQIGASGAGQPPRVGRVATAANSQAADAGQTLPLNGGRGPDIRGVRLGMKRSELLGALSKSSVVQSPMVPAAYQEGFCTNDNPPKEETQTCIEIFFDGASSAADPLVYAVLLQGLRLADDSGLDPKLLIQLFQEKYGPPKFDSSNPYGANAEWLGSTDLTGLPSPDIARDIIVDPMLVQSNARAVAADRDILYLSIARGTSRLGIEAYYGSICLVDVPAAFRNRAMSDEKLKQQQDIKNQAVINAVPKPHL